MKGMTIEELAKTCGVQDRTVRRWANRAADKMSSVEEKMSAAGHGKKTVFSLDEVLEIVRAGGRHTLAALLEENAKKSKTDHRVTRLPNGAQLAELRRIYGSYEAARRIDFAIGYSRGEAVATPEQARAGFQMVKNNLKQKQLEFNK